MRAELCGILRFHAAPGVLVEYGQPIATNVAVSGDAQSVIISPADGVVLGMTTLPAAKPGVSICNIAVPKKRPARIRKAYKNAARDDVTRQLRRELARNIAILPPGAHDEHWPKYEAWHVFPRRPHNRHPHQNR